MKTKLMRKTKKQINKNQSIKANKLKNNKLQKNKKINKIEQKIRCKNNLLFYYLFYCLLISII